jgi:hypothetical protein
MKRLNIPSKKFNFKHYLGSLFLFFLGTNSLNAQISLQLTPSSFNSYNVNCFGAKNGTINLTIAGGIPPYTILWSTGDSLEDLSNLTAGYYIVRVTDSDSLPQFAEADITLNEPRPLSIEGSVHTYTNGYNISIYGACNGIVSAVASGGVSPYSWEWSDGNTNQNRTGMCSGLYGLKITDANGCTVKKEGMLKEPDRSDWQMGGNAGTDASNHFLGTLDSVDLVIKTNNDEQMRIFADGTVEISGDLKIDSVSSDTIRLLYVDQNGILRTYGPGNNPPYAPQPDWSTTGNSIAGQQNRYLGTNDAADLVFKTADQFSGPTEKMRITQNGTIAIGTINTTIPTNYKLVVEGPIAAREVVIVKQGDPWPDYVFDANYKLKPLEAVDLYFDKNRKIEGFPTAAEIKESGQNLAEIQRLQQEKLEEVYLYLIELNKKIYKLETQNEILSREVLNLRKELK